jgi:uncharacterized hydrophobic protein (TIGR00271 family)
LQEADPPTPGHREHRLQEALARSLGIAAPRREQIVREMLQRHRIDAVSYWLQIVLATGIATYGLVLSSTGVVIGAMLISPLMGPIVGLGMGLAVGAPLLTLSSLFRVAASMVWVGGIAALLTVALPFHELTAEISARTSPTLLDLAVAVFCALAAGFTTARQSADTTSAAAGTAIGISLVPPLCVSGYGLGTAQWDVFGGALLLFTANCCAIIFCSALLFVALGFNHVRVGRHEDLEPLTSGRSRFAQRLHRIFGGRYGLILRFSVPALLVAAVYIPLRTALGEVAWKVRVRDAVTQMLRELAPDGRSVRTSLTVEAHTVRVRLALIGSVEEADTVAHELKQRIALLSGVAPDVHVTAVPDDEALRHIAAAAAVVEPSLPPLPEPPRVHELQRRIRDVLATRWPEDSGQLLHLQLGLGAAGTPTLTVVHTGAPIGPTAEALLAGLLQQALGEPMAVRGRAVPIGAWSPEDGEAPRAFMGDLLRALVATREEPRLHACVTAPPAPTETAPVAVTEGAPHEDHEALERLLATFAGPQLHVDAGPRWRVELRLDACPAPIAEAEPPIPSPESERAAASAGAPGSAQPPAP